VIRRVCDPTQLYVWNLSKNKENGLREQPRDYRELVFLVRREGYGSAERSQVHGGGSEQAVMSLKKLGISTTHGEG